MNIVASMSILRKGVPSCGAIESFFCSPEWLPALGSGIGNARLVKTAVHTCWQAGNRGGATSAYNVHDVSSARSGRLPTSKATPEPSMRSRISSI